MDSQLAAMQNEFDTVAQAHHATTFTVDCSRPNSSSNAAIGSFGCLHYLGVTQLTTVACNLRSWPPSWPPPSVPSRSKRTRQKTCRGKCSR